MLRRKEQVYSANGLIQEVKLHFLFSSSSLITFWFPVIWIRTTDIKLYSFITSSDLRFSAISKSFFAHWSHNVTELNGHYVKRVQHYLRCLSYYPFTIPPLSFFILFREDHLIFVGRKTRHENPAKEMKQEIQEDTPFSERDPILEKPLILFHVIFFISFFFLQIPFHPNGSVRYHWWRATSLSDTNQLTKKKIFCFSILTSKRNQDIYKNTLLDVGRISAKQRERDENGNEKRHFVSLPGDWLISFPYILFPCFPLNFLPDT